jgi:hypothetical protein
MLGAQALAQSGSLVVKHRGDHLLVTTPQKHFIEGKALEKLHNGSTVPFVLSLKVIEENSPAPTLVLHERFLISFDLWEEKFSVVHAESGGRTASRLALNMAEAWCLESMPIPLQTVSARQSFMVRLECSIDESSKESGAKGSSSLTLARLIDIFSRKRNTETPKWEAASGFLHLEDLKRISKAQ